MLMIWFNKPHDLTTFTPAWAFLFFPLMIVGVIAFNVLRVIPPEESRAIGVLLVGYAFTGLGAVARFSLSRMVLILGGNVGFFMTFFYICIYIVRYV
jgi:tellurite resistance protein TehA-like permease